MSALTVFNENAEARFHTIDAGEIRRQLADLGVMFEQWQPSAPVAAGDSQDAILAAYRQDVDRIIARHGFASVDVISVDRHHPQKEALRARFLDEHIHTEFEVRFFVDGCGLFFLHIGDTVYSVLCEKGDYISVPANTPHWFDLGPEPQLAAIRFFNNPDGWVAHYSGNPIAARFPRLDG